MDNHSRPSRSTAIGMRGRARLSCAPGRAAPYSSRGSAAQSLWPRFRSSWRMAAITLSAEQLRRSEQARQELQFLAQPIRICGAKMLFNLPMTALPNGKRAQQKRMAGIGQGQDGGCVCRRVEPRCSQDCAAPAASTRRSRSFGRSRGRSATSPMAARLRPVERQHQRKLVIGDIEGAQRLVEAPREARAPRAGWRSRDRYRGRTVLFHMTGAALT